MKRLTEKTVFSGLMTAWRLATCPTIRSPDLGFTATTDGISRDPSDVRDDDRLAAFHHCDDRVGRAQIDTDNFAHVRLVSLIEEKTTKFTD